MSDADEALAARARRALAGEDARIEPSAGQGGGYLLRVGPDRRRRPLLRLTNGAFERLAEQGVLSPDGDGWRLARTAAAISVAAPPAAGRPGVIEGERLAETPGEGVRPRRVNLGESPIVWLARRKGPDGRPLLSPQQAAAAERLRSDHALAGQLGRLTMDWSAMPRGAGGFPSLDPAERRVRAKAAVRRALEAVGPIYAPVLEAVLLRDSALEAAEKSLRLPRRAAGKRFREGLRLLAEHYAGA